MATTKVPKPTKTSGSKPARVPPRQKPAKVLPLAKPEVKAPLPKSVKSPPTKPASPTAPDAAPFSLGLNLADTSKVHNALRGGLPFHAFERFEKASGLTRAKLALAVGIAPRTLDRRQNERKLQPDESDRLYRLATIFARAAELFEGDVSAANHWLTNPVRGLGHNVPLDLAVTQIGAQMVLDLIGRLDHGVFS